MKSKQLGLAGALLISTVSSPAWADLVTNGNFSGGDDSVCHDQTCPGWTVTQAPTGSSFLFNDDNKDVAVPAGMGFATFGATEGITDELSQVLATVPGQSYTVSFLLGGSGAPQDQNFSVQWNGTTIFSETNNLPYPPGGVAAALAPISINPTATGSSTTLAFFGLNAPGTNVLAQVSVVPAISAGVPEPSTWTMMLLGFIGLGFALRHSRPKVSFA
jgi:hypothetical protein